MNPRVKKLVGTLAMLAWLVIYAFIVTGVAVRVLPHASWYASLLFYALAGTLWAVPVGLMFPWMHREKPK